MKSLSSSSSASGMSGKYVPIHLDHFLSKNSYSRLETYCCRINDHAYLDYMLENGKDGKEYFEFHLDGPRGNDFNIKDKSLKVIINKINKFINKIKKDSNLDLILR